VKARKTAEPVRSPQHAPPPKAKEPPAYRAGETPLDGRHSVPLLQSAAGNRAVTALLSGDPAVQRVPVTVPTRRETLFNQRGTPGQAGSAVYGDASGAKLDLSRGGTPEAVTVTVRIRFLSQARDATGSDTGAATVIPAGDERRTWARDMCVKAPALWTGKAKLVGKRAAKPRDTWDGLTNPDPGGPVSLPLVFKAVPVFEAASPAAPADITVNVFGSATKAGGDRHPIDAGHYYMNKGDYPFPEEAIYAHEYGHLLGLSDEYSHSNPQMHALLHDIDPKTSAARGKALDTETVRRMVLAALTRPLFNRLHGAGKEIGAVLASGSRPLRTALGAQLRTALADPGIQTLFAMNLPPAAAPLAPKVAAMVATSASAARNTTGLAAGVVAAELAPRTVRAMIDNRYFGALSALHGDTDVGGIGMSITVEGNAGITSDGEAVIPPSGVWKAASSGAMRNAASRIAGRVVGAAQQKDKPPPVRPSTTLIGQLEGLRKAWTTFPTAAPAGISSAVLQADLSTALVASWLAKLGTVAPTATNAKRLAAAADRAVHQAALAASTNALRALLVSQVEPVIQASVTALTTAVDTEVAAVLSTPAGAVAAGAPKDPDLAALATRLNAKLTAEVAAAKAAQAANPGSTAVDPGAGAPAQSVTYGTVNMMSDNTAVFRPDQYVALAAQFNDPAHHLRKEREDTFTVEKS
jgi:hypothetical protein